MNASVATLRDEAGELARRIGRDVQYMEVCGTHTVSLYRSGVRDLLPRGVRMISGPGCPVCVTAQRHIDAAIELALRPGTIIATYGDMLRVPGRLGSLEQRRAEGAQVHVVASARTALDLARQNPGDEVVFLAVGFETTAPATAAVIQQADREGTGNFSALVCHKLVVPAMTALLAGGRCALDGFLCPGHVSVIIGTRAYRPVVERRTGARPCVVAGFEPVQMLRGIVHLLRQTLAGTARIENVYPAVRARGNRAAMALLRDVFAPDDVVWRALGTIPRSGLRLRSRYERFDALRRFGVTPGGDADNPACRCGEVIQGLVEPDECPLYGTRCTPTDPVGPCMVSSEGTCAAWHRYHRHRGATAASRAVHRREERHVAAQE